MEELSANTITLRFINPEVPEVILDFASAIDLYHSTMLTFLFALAGAHQRGGAAKVEELHDVIKAWIQRQIRIQEVGEP